MKDAVIVSAVRTAVGKAPRGTLKDTRPDDMAAAAMKAAMERAPIDPAIVEDVIVGCANPEAESGMNVARQAAWLAGIPKEASAVTINRFCSSGLQAIAFAAERVMCGWSDCIVAGGTETMSLIPMGGHTIRPNPTLVETWPDFYLNMGLTAENLAKKYSISREEADTFSLRSHQKAAEAIAAGRFKDEVVPLQVKTVELDAKGK
ncbi:MAG TPA: acetyl-CoA C-acyltransferase, partial [Blastocatellia bacterium]|nr:acetyl-CoA C-acyltransferase [Blastocatellia bacterium]